MIGKVIYKLLHDSTGLAALVGQRIYPLAIDQDVALDGVLYKVSSTVPEYDKDGLVHEINEVDVCIYSLKYESLLNIAQAVRNALELKKGLIEGINVVYSRIQSMDEDYDFEANVYFKNIKFTIKTV